LLSFPAVVKAILFSMMKAALAATFVLATAAAHAQWTCDGPNSQITHSSGWKFMVVFTQTGVSELSLSPFDCIGSPATARSLPFGEVISPSGGWSYKMIGIEGSNRAGGILGTHRAKATSLTLPSTLTRIGNHAFNDCPASRGR
jgi:hypothetical protein